jgi:hypothetical protein
MGDIRAWLMDRNWKTWAGHAFLGFLFAMLVVQVDDPGAAFWAVAIAFMYREADNFLMHAEKGEGLKGKLAAGWESVRKDGYFDLITPFIGYGLAMVLTGNAVGAYTALAIVSLVGGIAAFIFGHRLLRKKWPWEGMD